jgi:hypothetical protein
MFLCSVFFLCYRSFIAVFTADAPTSYDKPARAVFRFASDTFPTFWRENATNATGTKKKRISSAIVERRRGFRVSLIFCASPKSVMNVFSPFIYRGFRRLTPPRAPFS